MKSFEGATVVKGVIAAGNRYTAEAGAEVLAAGGNAADAAVAAAFVSFQSEIGFVHLGGSGIAQVFAPERGAVVYDFFSNYPGLDGLQSPPQDLDFQPVEIDYGGDRQTFHVGRGSVAVPGNVFGLWEIARDFGSLPWKRLLQGAIRMARRGCVLDRFQTETCRLLKPLYTHTPGIREIFAPGGRMVQPGHRIHLSGLAETLEELAEQGGTCLREGNLARAVIADQQANGGLLTEADLSHYQVDQGEPIRIPYRDHELLLPSLSSVGGALTAFALAVLSRLQSRFDPAGTARHLRLVAEVLTAAAEARSLWEQWSATHPSERLDRLLDEARLEACAARVRNSLQEPARTPPQEAPGPGSTSHLSVLDEQGMAVSLTTTAGESAGYVVPQTGLILNNMLGEEDLFPSGFHRGTPGRRISTMITPSLILRDGSVSSVIGTGGSSRIRSAILQVVNNLLDLEMPLEQAVEAPRVHPQDGLLHCEGGVAPESARELERQGYRVNAWSKRSIYFGGAHCVGRSSQGALLGAGDSRRGGSVAYAE